MKKWREDFNKRFNTNIQRIGDYITYSVNEGIFTWKKDLKVKVDDREHTIKAGTEFNSAIGQTGESGRNWNLREIVLPVWSMSKQKQQHSEDEQELNKDKSWWQGWKTKDEQPFFDEWLKSANYARGFGAFTKPQIIQVGDQPKGQGQELVFTEKKFNQIIGDIIDNNKLRQDRDAMMAMIPAMASQGGGGTSMPIVNNSYSYQNVDNVVTELPTTSLLNMTNALS
jgi:hypothetical protein